MANNPFGGQGNAFLTATNNLFSARNPQFSDIIKGIPTNKPVKGSDILNQVTGRYVENQAKLKGMGEEYKNLATGGEMADMPLPSATPTETVGNLAPAAEAATLAPTGNAGYDSAMGNISKILTDSGLDANKLLTQPNKDAQGNPIQYGPGGEVTPIYDWGGGVWKAGQPPAKNIYGYYDTEPPDNVPITKNMGVGTVQTTPYIQTEFGWVPVDEYLTNASSPIVSGQTPSVFAALQDTLNMKKDADTQSTFSKYYGPLLKALDMAIMSYGAGAVLGDAAALSGLGNIAPAAAPEVGGGVANAGMSQLPGAGVGLASEGGLVAPGAVSSTAGSVFDAIPSLKGAGEGLGFEGAPVSSPLTETSSFNKLLNKTQNPLVKKLLMEAVQKLIPQGQAGTGPDIEGLTNYMQDQYAKNYGNNYGGVLEQAASPLTSNGGYTYEEMLKEPAADEAASTPFMSAKDKSKYLKTLSKLRSIRRAQ